MPRRYRSSRRRVRRPVWSGIGAYYNRSNRLPKSASRYFRRLRGHGDYGGNFWKRAQNYSSEHIKPFAKGGRSLGSSIGMALGGGPGSSVGESIGGWIGDALGSWTGLGAYKVQSNSLMNLKTGSSDYMGMGPPAVINSRNGVRIKHREYITDVSSDQAFTLFNLFINPGLATTFPWLFTIARNFEQYKFHGLIFMFKSTSADSLSSTNTALGTVIMATDYNSAAPNFTNKAQMENNEWTVSSKPSCSVIHPIECSPRESQVKLYYVRSDGEIPNGQDQRLYDMGNFQFAAQGSQANAIIGELWCSYDVEFFKPVLGDGNFPPSAIYSIQGPLVGFQANGGTGETVLGPESQGFTNIVDTIGLSIDRVLVAPSVVVEMPAGTPPGNYMVTYGINGTFGSDGFCGASIGALANCANQRVHIDPVHPSQNGNVVGTIDYPYSNALDAVNYLSGPNTQGVCCCAILEVSDFALPSTFQIDPFTAGFLGPQGSSRSATLTVSSINPNFTQLSSYQP